jgi:hypothetical protein
MTDQRLQFWTVYCFLAGTYVACHSRADEAQLGRLMVSSDLEALRDRIERLGFGLYGRDPEDDRTIVEVWVS